MYYESFICWRIDQKTKALLPKINILRLSKQQYDEIGEFRTQQGMECIAILRTHGSKWGLSEHSIRSFRERLNEGRHALLSKGWPEYRVWQYWTVTDDLDVVRRARNDLCHTCHPPVTMALAIQLADSLIRLYQCVDMIASWTCGSRWCGYRAACRSSMSAARTSRSVCAIGWRQCARARELPRRRAVWCC